ncbi:cytochrome b/b6 domain-containing protein [Bacillus shivajii]|uniref:formate dehydrogenase subunit gamma n=1 Tax=Bacillus shivajii TaxID=1983719 RepID=UPI001CFBA1CA|nr:cytochrome b/b6 domain-containing protein [Bacillus shivajii]UCZ52466.1 cytochrome b/b6 domain-containing protein [Bacillus shivajii]
MKNKKEKVYRQPLPNRFVHWLTAISIFMLIITGLGQMPLYGRYLIYQPFGTQWLTSYELTLWVHYIFAAVLVFIVFYHIVYHVIKKEFDIVPKKGDVKGSYEVVKAMILRKKEPPSEKYLPEQRLAYAFFSGAILLAIVTGFFKVIKNIQGVQASDGWLLWGAQLHNLATFLIIFGIVMHLAAFIVKANRKLLPGMFTGFVDKEYVKERHSLWYDKKSEEKQAKK